MFLPTSIEMRDGARAAIAVRAGTIALGEHSMTIALSIVRTGRTVPFAYNGSYRIGR